MRVGVSTDLRMNKQMDEPTMAAMVTPAGTQMDNKTGILQRTLPRNRTHPMRFHTIYLSSRLSIKTVSRAAERNIPSILSQKPNARHRLRKAFCVIYHSRLDLNEHITPGGHLVSRSPSNLFKKHLKQVRQRSARSQNPGSHSFLPVKALNGQPWAWN